MYEPLGLDRGLLLPERMSTNSARIVAVLVVAAALAGPPGARTARADDFEFASYGGTGWGGAARPGAGLDRDFKSDGLSGRVVIGGRVFGVAGELNIAISSLRHTTSLDPRDEPRHGVLYVPTVKYFFASKYGFELYTRGGLALGSLGGDESESTQPCPPELDCATRVVTYEPPSYFTYGLDLGGGAQFTVRSRRNHAYFALWADWGLQLLRVGIDGQPAAHGTLGQLTFGFAFGTSR